MLTFIDQTDYQKATYEQISPSEIRWQFQEEGRLHSGLFVSGRKSNHLRGEYDFEPFQEVIELGLVPSFDTQSHADALANSQKENERLALKAKRDNDLLTISHDFGDGRIIQVRPQDIANFQLAIAMGNATEWIMEDNSIAVVTVAELQIAFDAGVARGEQIYREYMAAVKTL